MKIDFPRIPFTSDYGLFQTISDHGKDLVDLHLLQSSQLDPPIAKFQGKGTDRVEKLKYDKRKSRIYINKDQYFEGVPQEIWEYQIGGYQVCNKWLKDRIRKAPLSTSDIKHYCRVATAMKKTIEVQRNIDAIYLEVEKEIIEFQW